MYEDFPMIDVPPVQDPVPLEMTVDGVIRVSGTRVPLEAVIVAFRDGATPEEIVWQYPTLQLADVYGVVSYYLHHQREVETYLEQREQIRQTVLAQNEARFNPQGIRARLLARRAKQS